MYGLPGLDYQETLDQVRSLLAVETHLDQEQEHLQEAKLLEADYPFVHIPDLLPYCSPRVTAMERIRGVKVTSAPADGYRIAHWIADVLVAAPLWSEQDSALFHGDPHAGNIIVTDDGRVAILDWTLAGRLYTREREQFVQLLLAGLIGSPERAARAIEILAQHADQRQLNVVVRAAAARLSERRTKASEWLLEILDEAITSGAAQFSEEVLLLRKSLLTLDGVVEDLSVGFSVVHVVTARGAQRLVRELTTTRPWAPPDSRSFRTHLSNRDVSSALYDVRVQGVRRLADGVLRLRAQLHGAIGLG